MCLASHPESEEEVESIAAGDEPGRPQCLASEKIPHSHLSPNRPWDASTVEEATTTRITTTMAAAREHLLPVLIIVVVVVAKSGNQEKEKEKERENKVLLRWITSPMPPVPNARCRYEHECSGVTAMIILTLITRKMQSVLSAVNVVT
mmetsp:Transcript_1882/g.5124  ORF Transcript_1882/g.5124 Transcript_1882/m.5124 type:complete len:148 (-) Transcript_1882:581-1024(-)